MILECNEDETMQEDMEWLADTAFSDEDFAGGTILVTGATGLIGSQTVRALACINRHRNLNMTLLAFVRNKEKAEKMFGGLLKRGDVELCIGDINEHLETDKNVDYIIHGASATSSKYFVSNPVETIMTAISGTKRVLDFAKKKSVKGMVYLSSLEVYGTPDACRELITERDYGYIDPLCARSSYSEGKRMAECLCAAYAKEYCVPVKIARLSQTFGAGVEYNDGRVFAEFARCAVEGRDIVLHTAGKTVRSYCYTKDAVSAILHILLRGEAGEAYNVTNMNTVISIREMAELVCKTIGESKICVISDIPDELDSYGYNPEMVIKLDSARLSDLGWKPTVDLPEMYQRMINSWKKQER